jgi:hypothetical protein
MDWHHSHVWCNTSSPDLSQIYCSEISGDVPDASHWRNGYESALYSIDRGTRDPRPSSQSSATGCSRHHARSASVSVFVRFHAFHLSFTPVPSTVHTNIQLLYCHHCYSPITLSPSFLRERRPSRLQSLPFSPLRRRRHAVTPLARSQP